MPSVASNRANLAKARATGRVKVWRSAGETQLIKRAIWAWWWSDPRPYSLRALARQLGVRLSYVQKVMRSATTEGMDILLRQAPPTPADLERERAATEQMRRLEPDLFQPQREAKDSSLENAPASQKPQAMPLQQSHSSTSTIAPRRRLSSVWRSQLPRFSDPWR